jgi:hypothetical protein
VSAEISGPTIQDMKALIFFSVNFQFVKALNGILQVHQALVAKKSKYKLFII